MSYVFKIIVVGDGGVGKTALALRCTTKVFVENYKVTIGVDFRIKRLTVDNIQSKLLIWDTGGQERFSTIRSHYFDGARGALMVYDITNERSFRNIEKWISEVKKHCDNIPLVLVGNKADLEQLRRVSTKDGEKLANEMGCLFFEASAKTGENVEGVFRTLNRIMIEHALKKKSARTKNDIETKKQLQRSERDISKRINSKNKTLTKKKVRRE